MNLALDVHAYLDSPIHRWQARQKLIGLAALIFAFSFIQDLRLLPPMLLVTLLLFLLSRLPFTFLLRRLRYPGLFLLAVAVLLPLLSGQTVLATFGPFALRQEGLLHMILIVAKFSSILTLSLILFGTAPFLTSIKAIRSLGLSPILADMMLLSYRYIFEIGGDLQRMQTSMGLRGFPGRRSAMHRLNNLAALAGSLLIRSYEQAERVYHAMILRGYGQTANIYARDESQATLADKTAMLLMLFLALAFVALEIFLRGGTL